MERDGRPWPVVGSLGHLDSAAMEWRTDSHHAVRLATIEARISGSCCAKSVRSPRSASRSSAQTACVIIVHDHDDEETGAVDVQSIGPEEQSAAEQERVPLTIFHFPQR